jgi:hypothetical protein
MQGNGTGIADDGIVGSTAHDEYDPGVVGSNDF